MKIFLQLLPLFASVSSNQDNLLTPEQVQAAYHNNGVLYSQLEHDGTVIFFEDHTHLPYYYSMSMRDLYIDYLLTMWPDIQSSLLNFVYISPDSFKQFLLTHSITTEDFQRWTQSYNITGTFTPTLWSLYGAQGFLVPATARHEGIQSYYDFRTLSTDQLKKDAQKLIDDVRAVYDAVGSVEKEEVTFHNVIKPLMEIGRESYTRGVALTLPGRVALDKDLRDASREVDKQMNEVSVELDMRKDIFENIVAFNLTGEAQALYPEQTRFVEESLSEGKRNGLHLTEDKRLRIQNIKKRISELGVNFHKNLNEDTSFLAFEEFQLSGVPEDLMNSFERDESEKFIVSLKDPNFYTVIKKCNNPNSRFLMEKAKGSMDENTDIIEEIVELRRKQAKLLGYEDHASYVQEINMAKNPGTVHKFLVELNSKLKPLWEDEQKVMLEMKKVESEELGLEYSGKLDFWDIRYYQAMVEEKKYAVDQQKLKEYFPMELVTVGMMDIYQKIFGLKFNKIKGGEVWHEDVEMWKVVDQASGDTLGYFYLDLYPRDGKSNGASMTQLQPGSLDSKGNRQKSVVLMLTNFPKPTDEKPSLLNHYHVKTYFHEFGHVMHGICSQTNTSQFFGPNVERDFVEAPSQMLENWVWEEESLRLMSGHYKDGSPLPKDMLDKLVASRNANAGGYNLGQIFYASYDQRLHTRKTTLDTLQLTQNMFKEIFGIDTIPGTNLAPVFLHLVGYDAQYYSYLWSEVYSKDMFAARFAKEGIMNPDTGMDYRNSILKPGGSVDSLILLKNFIGREPNQEAFLRSKGLAL